MAELGDEIVDRMDAHAAEPIEIFRAVVDGVKGPPAAAVKEAVGPVTHEIGDEKNLDDLQPERLAGERAEAVVGPGLEPGDGRDPESDEQPRPGR